MVAKTGKKSIDKNISKFLQNFEEKVCPIYELEVHFEPKTNKENTTDKIARWDRVTLSLNNHQIYFYHRQNSVKLYKIHHKNKFFPNLIELNYDFKNISPRTRFNIGVLSSVLYDKGYGLENFKMEVKSNIIRENFKKNNLNKKGINIFEEECLFFKQFKEDYKTNSHYENLKKIDDNKISVSYKKLDFKGDKIDISFTEKICRLIIDKSQIFKIDEENKKITLSKETYEDHKDTSNRIFDNLEKSYKKFTEIKKKKGVIQ